MMARLSITTKSRNGLWIWWRSTGYVHSGFATIVLWRGTGKTKCQIMVSKWSRYLKVRLFGHTHSNDWAGYSRNTVSYTKIIRYSGIIA